MSGSEVRVRVASEGTSQWRIEVVARDRVGLLSSVAAALSELGLDVSDAVVSTWPDGTALTGFGVRRAEPPVADEIEDRIRHSLDRDLASEPVEASVVAFDDSASPWHTICTVEATDRPGLLHAVTAAFAAAGASVHSARISTRGGAVADTFELTDTTGAKLDPSRQQRILELLETGVRPVRRRRFARLKD